MGLPLELDEIDEGKLAHELLNRYKARSQDLCAYCGGSVWTAPCKMRHWHRPRIIALCGSTRDEFIPVWEAANRRFTKDGAIVLTVAFFKRDQPSAGLKESLDRLHLQKILMADSVHVLNVDGYIGEGTQAEIDFAKQHNKPVYYWEA